MLLPLGFGEGVLVGEVEPQPFGERRCYPGSFLWAKLGPNTKKQTSSRVEFVQGRFVKLQGNIKVSLGIYPASCRGWCFLGDVFLWLEGGDQFRGEQNGLEIAF